MKKNFLSNISKDSLIQSHKIFEKKEPRGRVYDVSRKLFLKDDKDNKILGAFIFLEIWNQSFQRYLKFDYDKFGEKFLSINKRISKFTRKYKHQKIPIINFLKNEDEKVIKKLYNDCAKYFGGKLKSKDKEKVRDLKSNTGASKILHFINPDLFCMWDTKYRPVFSIYECSGKSYYEFLKLLSNIIIKNKKAFLNAQKNIKPKLSIIKILDEYLYVNITLKILKDNKTGKYIRRQIKQYFKN